jgi:hypothetical protein
MAESDLVAALVKRAEGHRDRVPVFQILQPSPEESIARAQNLAAAVWPQFGDCSFRVDVIETALARVRLPHDGRVDVFHRSGSIAALMQPPASRTPFAVDERRADRAPLVRRAQEAAATIGKAQVVANDDMRQESTWERKGRGVTLRGESTPVALFEILVAFRRYLHGLPVLGRASLHVGLAGSHVTRWGIDWRRVQPDPVAHTPVVDPQEAAKRVVDDLWWRRPEKPFTLDDLEPKSLRLGYLSMSRRREQYVMQPAWVAVLASRSRQTSIGHVVAVPASPRAFEPMDRPAKMHTIARA